MGSKPEMLQHYRAAMVLSGVGDALGYKNQAWEYCKSGLMIHEQLRELGGVENVDIKLPDWPVSDDTVMHLATAEALCSGKSNKNDVLLEIASKYKECMKDMEGRKPGPTSIKGTDQLKPSEPEGYVIPFNPTGTGCGACMRSMCIGLRFPRIEDEDDLIMYSIESGRMTHNHPTGYLGSLASALFTAYAVRGKPLNSWGKGLVDILPRAWSYVEREGRDVEQNKDHWTYFGEKWRWYLDHRGLSDGEKDPVFPEKYGIEERDREYTTFSEQKIQKEYGLGDDNWAGRSGHDAPMIAYDALLASGKDWVGLCERGMLHGGDNDSTGVIAGCCFGAMYGYDTVPELNYQNLEYRDRLEDMGGKLYQLSQQQ